MDTVKRVNTTGYRVTKYRVIHDGERAAAPKSYAIATETYVEQDGWVLRADGMTLHGSILPIMLNHGWGEELPLGKWSNIRSQGSEIIADPQWAESLDDEEMKVKMRADEGLLQASIRFVVDEYADPTPEERIKYGIPDDARYAMIAKKWRAMEASFVTVPADGKCGPRALAALHARAAELPEAERDARLEKIEKTLATMAGDILFLRSKSVTDTQPGTDNGLACGPRGVQNATENGHATRSNLYNSESLGFNLAELLRKIPAGKTVKQENAKPDSCPGNAGG